jgi:hypothetical protein
MLVSLLVLGVAFCFPYVSEADCNAYTADSTCDSQSK